MSLLYKSHKCQRRRREARLMVNLLLLGGQRFSLEREVMRNRSAAAQIKDFRRLFSLAGPLCVYPNMLHGRVDCLNMCLRSRASSCGRILRLTQLRSLKRCMLSLILVPGRRTGALGAGVCYSVPDHGGSEAPGQWPSCEQQEAEETEEDFLSECAKEAAGDRELY